MKWPFSRKEEKIDATRQEATFPQVEKAAGLTIQNVSIASALGYSTLRRQLLDTYNHDDALRKVVSKIGDLVATAPIKTGRRDRAGTMQEAVGHPLTQLFAYGNESMSGFDVVKTLNTLLDIAGEAFILLEYSGNVVVGLWPVPPTWVTAVPATEDEKYKVNFGGPRDVPADEIVWIREVDPVNPMGRGTGAAVTLDLALDAYRYSMVLQKNSFVNRGRPDGIISIEGASQGQCEAFQQKLEANHGGADKYGRLLFTGSPVDFKSWERNFSELQLIQLRQEVRDLIRNLYGVPPEILGELANSNRATITAAARILYLGVVQPRQARIVRALNRQFVPQIDKTVEVYFDSHEPDDLDFKFQVMASQPYMFTLNQWRKLAGEKDLGVQGEVRYVPLSLIEVREELRYVPLSLIEVREGEPMPEPMPMGAPVTVVESDGEESDDGEESEEDKAAHVHTKAAVNWEDVSGTVDALNPVELRTEFLPAWREEIAKWGKKILQDLGIEAAFNMQSPAVLEYTRKLGASRITSINETTRADLRAALFEGIDAGEGVIQLRARLRKVFDQLSTSRAETIARTESGLAANFATFEGMRQSGVVEKKQWLGAPATPADHRESHVTPPPGGLHGKVVPFNETFDVEGSPAMYPQDDTLPADQSINCMCTMIPVFQKPKTLEELEPLRKAWPRKIEESTRIMKEAIVRGARRQEKKALEVFDRLTRGL